MSQVKDETLGKRWHDRYARQSLEVWQAASLTGAIGAILAILLILPGRTYIARYAIDVVGFMDTTDRILKGQIPNVDFSNIMGPLAAIPLVGGVWLGGSFGNMLPIGTALMLAAFIPFLVYVMATRLTATTGAIFAIFALVVMAAPLNPGDSARMVTFAMYYNRWGWVILSLVLLMVLPVRRETKPVLEALAIATPLLALFYLKVTYAVVGWGFVGLYALLFPQMRRSILFALAASIVGLVGIDAFWGGTSGYINDLRNAASQSGALRGDGLPLAGIFLKNVSDFLLLAAILALAYVRGAQGRYLAISAAIGLAGLPLFNQAAQIAGVHTVVPAALVAMLAPAKDDRTPLAETLILAAMTLAMTVSPMMALAWHAVQASRSPQDPRDELLGIVVTSAVAEVTVPTARLMEAYTTQVVSRSDLSTIAAGGFPEADRLYFWSIHDGMALIRRHAQAGRVMTFDAVNPFNAMMGRMPPRGPFVYLGEFRTIGREHHPSGKVILGEAEFVMVPAFPRNPGSKRILLELYSDHLRTHYDLVDQDGFWQLWMRKSLSLGHAPEG